MLEVTPQILRSRNGWLYNGQARPEFAHDTLEPQESVWDYPRPPLLSPDTREFVVKIDDRVIAKTRDAVRVLETGGAPTIYFPREAVASDIVVDRDSQTVCEWKGFAHPTNWRGDVEHPVGWTYVETFPEFATLQNWFSFYPLLVDCFVDGERARPQAGGYYGGWITDEIVGPFKGDQGVTDPKK